jgi:hypothetical protein
MAASSDEGERLSCELQQIGTNPNGGRVSRCSRCCRPKALCTPKADIAPPYNPLEDNSLFVSGWREQYGASAAGGANLLQYFLAGDFSRDVASYVNTSRAVSAFDSNLNAELAPTVTAAARLGYFRTGSSCRRTTTRPGPARQRPARA